MWCKECNKECVLTSWKCSCGHYKTAHAVQATAVTASTTTATTFRNDVSVAPKPAPAKAFAFPPATVSTATTSGDAKSATQVNSVGFAGFRPKPGSVASTTTTTTSSSTTTTRPGRSSSVTPPTVIVSGVSTKNSGSSVQSIVTTSTAAASIASASTTTAHTTAHTTASTTVTTAATTTAPPTTATTAATQTIAPRNIISSVASSTAPSANTTATTSATPEASTVKTSPSVTATATTTASSSDHVSINSTASVGAPALPPFSSVSREVPIVVSPAVTVSKPVAIAVEDSKGGTAEWDNQTHNGRRGRASTLTTTARDKSPSMIGRLFSNIRTKSPTNNPKSRRDRDNDSLKKSAIQALRQQDEASMESSRSSTSTFVQEPLTPLRAVRGEMTKSANKKSPTNSRACSCGAAIAQFAVFCGDCGKVVVETCSCGGLLEIDAVFCGECGKGKEFAEEKSRRATEARPPEPLPVLPTSQLGVVPALVALITKIETDNIQSSVEAMLGLERAIELTYDKERVKIYRALGGGNDYSKDGIFDWSCPEYLSEISIPTQGLCACVVHLGAETKLTFPIGAQDQCSQLLQKTFQKAQSRTAMGEMHADDYVLKVLGKSAYLDGPSLVLDHLSVREAIRSGKPVALILVKRPEPIPPKTSVWKDWGGGVQVLPSLADAIPISETSNLFRARDLQVLSVNFSTETPPQKNSMIHVKLFLLHGGVSLAEDTTTTQYIPGSRNFHFSRDLAPPLARLAEFPRETCVCFAILLIETHNTTLLGWLKFNLYDERGLLLQGFFTSEIREPMRLPQDCVDFNTELISQLARGPIGFPAKSQGHSCEISFQLEEFDGKLVIADEPKKQAVGARGRAQTAVGAGGARPLPMNFRPFQLPAMRTPSNANPHNHPADTSEPNTPSRTSHSSSEDLVIPHALPSPMAPYSNPIRVAITTPERLNTDEKDDEFLRVLNENDSGNSRSRGLSIEADKSSRLSTSSGFETSTRFSSCCSPSSVSSPSEPLSSRSRAASKGARGRESHNVSNDTLDQRLARDPAYILTPADKLHLWEVRHTMVFMDKPEIVTAFFQSIDWRDPEKRSEAHRMLDLLVPSPLETALQLLDAKFADTKLRTYAVQSLSHVSSSKLQPFLLQLTQCLKYEPYHHSALESFLIQSALRHPLTIGQPLYWHLRSEMCMNPALAERYALIIASFLSHGGPLVRELRKQKVALEQLQRVAESVASKKESDIPKEEIMEEYVGELVKLNCYLFARWGKMRLPFNPLVEVTTLIVDKCRFMSSKKVPLWLVFQNADPNETEPVYVMFKSGDDLRQDMLTLQILSYMDEIWRQENLDLRLTTYRVIATGVNGSNEGLGMIEVVLNADTTSGIQNDFGGGALGAFKLAPLKDYLEKHNPTEASLTNAVDRFMRSSAGYCVATYIMGIGDRHNGNIMVSKDGRLFHIDFGHFLGNFKSKFGIRRERAPFVFTPEMAYVIGGKQFQQHPAYQQFEALCVQAFNAIRTRAAVLGTLFGLMVPAGMPELLSEDDVTYMWEQLCLDLSTEEAAAVFLKELKASVSATSRRIDNFFHIAKHS